MAYFINIIQYLTVGIYEPKTVKIDLTDNAAADTVVINLNYRMAVAGGWILQDTVTYAGVQVRPLINIDLEPNRYGIWITLQRAGGGAQDYDWEVTYKD